MKLIPGWPRKPAQIPAPHHHDPVGQGQCLGLVMGDIDDGRAKRTVQFLDLGPHRVAGGHPAPQELWVDGPWSERLLFAGSETSTPKAGYLPGALSKLHTARRLRAAMTQRRIDHLVLAVHDHEPPAEFCRRLGFQVGPRNRHTLGTENGLIQMRSAAPHSAQDMVGFTLRESGRLRMVSDVCPAWFSSYRVTVPDLTRLSDLLRDQGVQHQTDAQRVMIDERDAFGSRSGSR
ncbi:VOC family protein [Paracoccus sp. NGMCC 1.201697]|uniref:VOC family protein n=1 Tax=Paracoccus broussonetiae subsp. drimophilus TaxID=3373869 RepID=A0ABW7LFN7_9RHOB